MKEQREESPGSVLVVDDDPVQRLVLEVMLRDNKFNVMVAEDGREGCDIYKQHFPDCILADVMMPNMDGFEMCRRIRGYEKGERVQILMLTSRDDIESIRAAYAAGATDFAQKGMNPEVLIERVRFLIRSQRMNDALLENELRLHHAERLALLGHWERTVEGQTVAASPMINFILGMPDNVTPKWTDLLRRTPESDRVRLNAAIEEAVSKSGSYSVNHRIVLEDGTIKEVLQEGEAVELHDAGTVLIRSILQDISLRYRRDSLAESA